MRRRMSRVPPERGVKVPASRWAGVTQLKRLILKGAERLKGRGALVSPVGLFFRGWPMICWLVQVHQRNNLDRV
jgi:hypothetical protein